MRLPVPLLAAALAAGFGPAIAPGPALAAGHSSHGSRAAAPPRADQPRRLGTYEEWEAATHLEGGQTVCYAFTRSQGSRKGDPRGPAVLTVTQRPSGRDVAISAGYSYPPNAEVKLQVDRTELSFYTAQRSAFARDNRAAIAALAKGRQAVARGPGPRGKDVTETFSLRGFETAYAALGKACPAK